MNSKQSKTLKNIFFQPTKSNINWEDIETLSRTGLNWNDINVLSKSFKIQTK